MAKSSNDKLPPPSNTAFAVYTVEEPSSPEGEGLVIVKDGETLKLRRLIGGQNIIVEVDPNDDRRLIISSTAGGGAVDTSNLLTKDVYDANDNGAVDLAEQADTANSATLLKDGADEISIPDVQALQAAAHTHANKTLLDTIINSGGGTLFLTDDGTYKAAPTGDGDGDMLKSIYDASNSGRVDAAESVSDGTNVSTAVEVKDAVDKAHEHSNLALLEDIEGALLGFELDDDVYDDIDTGVIIIDTDKGPNFHTIVDAPSVFRLPPPPDPGETYTCFVQLWLYPDSSIDIENDSNNPYAYVGSFDGTYDDIAGTIYNLVIRYSHMLERWDISVSSGFKEVSLITNDFYEVPIQDMTLGHQASGFTDLWGAASLTVDGTEGNKYLRFDSGGTTWCCKTLDILGTIAEECDILMDVQIKASITAPRVNAISHASLSGSNRLGYSTGIRTTEFDSLYMPPQGFVIVAESMAVNEQNVWYRTRHRVRKELDGSGNPTGRYIIRYRKYDPAGAEPSGWDIEFTTANPAPYLNGRIGINSYAPNAWIRMMRVATGLNIAPNPA